MTSEAPVAVIEGPKGTAEIYEAIGREIIEDQVKVKDETKVFNNLGEAYLEAGELAGTKT